MKLFHKEVSFSSKSLANVINPVFNDLSDGGRFYCNLVRAYGPEAYISRIGTWSNPWETKIVPGLEMPNYDPSFNYTFSEVSDMRAQDVKKIINETGKDCIVFYSGGIDSTVTLVSLLKNLNQAELKKIKISLSSDSIIENPYFYKKFIQNKFEIIDSMSNMYSDCINQNGYICITSDLGDFIYGTELGVKLYPQLHALENKLPANIKKSYSHIYNKVSSPDTHYSEYKDLLILYFNLGLEKGIKQLETRLDYPRSLSSRTAVDQQFGELFYEKLNHNIKTSGIPVHSLHDLFWWSMFNQRYIWGAIRPSLNYGNESNIKNTFEQGIVNWFGSKEYQLWSLNNNNNGEKICGSTQSSYKWASKKYIYEFDKNEWYLFNKIKMPSMPVIIKRNWNKFSENFDTKFGLDTDFNVIHINEPGVNDYIIAGLSNYKIDWV
jgi:hypothetical protein